MHDPSELDLQKTPVAPPPARPPRSPLPWIVGVVVFVAAAVTVYLLFGDRSAPDPVVVEAPPVQEPAVPADRPLGADVEPIDLPPLDETDALVRSLVSTLSSHPRIAAWLATDHLIRNFTVVVDNIAAGNSPATHLRVLRPTGPFRVVEVGDALLVDPATYERYATLAAAADSVDPQGAAQLYALLKPRIEDAYRDLGRTDTFDRRLEQALVVLLDTPALDASVRVTPEGGVYEFENPGLERLSAAQKQFARMGARNVRIVQARLREIGLALGIPAERLRRAG